MSDGTIKIEGADGSALYLPAGMKPICELWVVMKPDGSLKHRAGFDSAREADSFASDVYGMANQSPRLEPRRVVCIDAEEWEKAVSPQRAQGAQSGEGDDRYGEISCDEAAEIALKFIAVHFNKPGRETPRASIPADPRRDDDLRLMEFIRRVKRTQHAAPSTQHRSAYELTGETSLRSVMAKAGVLP